MDLLVWQSVDVYDAVISVSGLEHENFLINPLEVIAKNRLRDLTVHGSTDPQTRLNSEALVPITISSPILYSIGINPIGLWLGADSTWYSIYLADIYNEVWMSISTTISIFFHMVDYYQEDSARFNLPVADQVLEALTKSISTQNNGSSIYEMVRTCRRNSEFLILHIEATEPEHFAYDGTTKIDLRKSGFYIWLCDFPEIGGLLGHVNSSNLEELIEFDGDMDVNYNPLDSITVDAQGDVQMADEIDNDIRMTDSPVSSIRRGKDPPHKGQYISPERPAGSPFPTTITDIFLALTYHFIATRRDDRTLDNLSAGSVQNAIYKDFSLSRPEIGARLLRDNAQAIYNALPPKFKAGRIGIDLLAMTKMPPISGRIECNNDTNTRKANEQYDRLVGREEILRQRGKNVPSSAKVATMALAQSLTLASRSTAAQAPAQGQASSSNNVGADGTGGVVGAVGGGSSGGGGGSGGKTPGFINGKPIPKPIKLSGMYGYGYYGRQ